jgi:hypothetical protein
MMETVSPRPIFAGARARFNFPDDLHLRRKLSQIGRAHRIAIARGARKRRDVAIGYDSLGEDAAGGPEQTNRFFPARLHFGRSLFDNAAGVFESQNKGMS